MGVVCPSCRMLLRIPAPGDSPPPLVIPLAGVQAEKSENTDAAESPGASDGRRRRRKRSRKGEDHSWDSANAKHSSTRRGERRQMFWMLVGGGTLFALIVAGVLVAMLGGNDPAPSITTGDNSGTGPANDGGNDGRSDKEFLAMAEPLAQRFLDATRVDDLLPLVRHPEITEERMRNFYPNGRITAPGLSNFNTESRVIRDGNLVSILVRTGEYETKMLSFYETPEATLVDWESWVGWSEMPWADFMAEKPTEARMFRLNLSEIDYYNFGFTDDTEWQSYRLESPDGETSLYGYAKVGSVLNARLKPAPDVRRMPVTVSLKFPKNPMSPNQVLIESFIAEGWALESEEPP